MIILHRNLEWRGGHFNVGSRAITSHGDREVSNEHILNSMYKSCTFTPNFGSVGTAYAEGRHIWLNGAAVHLSAGSTEQAQFLRHAGIQTAICIPWSDIVLELGTCENVAEDLKLMERIRIFITERILPALLGTSQSPPNSPPIVYNIGSPFSSYSSMGHLSGDLNYQEFDPNSLNQQMRRLTKAPTSLNTVEMGSGSDTDLLLDPALWTIPTTSKPTCGILQSQPADQMPPQSIPCRGQHRSQSATTSTSGSSLEDRFNTRLSDNSPEQLHMSQCMTSSVRCNSSPNSRSLPRGGGSPHSPESMNELHDTNTDPITAFQSLPQHEGSQKAFSFMQNEEVELSTQEDLQHVYNPSLKSGNASERNLLRSFASILAEDHGEQPDSKSCPRAHVLAPIFNTNFDGSSQKLVRKAVEIMKQIPNLQQGIQASGSAPPNIEQQQPPLASCSSPKASKDADEARDPFGQDAPWSGRKRPCRGSRIPRTDQVHRAHGEAATNHMLAERRRRVKQKENFNALRKLVPIISKADKASILGDAIFYLKDLQKQLEELEAISTQTENQYKILRSSYNNLQRQNEELEAIARNDALCHTIPTRLNSC